MTTPSVSVVLLLLASSAAAASPALAPSVTVMGGTHVGWSEYPDDGGVTSGFDASAELRIGWVTLGGTLGVTPFPGSSKGVPIAVSTQVAHGGVSIPFYEHAQRGFVLHARAVAELGRHRYSASGDEPGFNLLGPSVTYEGPTRSVWFTGARAGVALVIADPRPARPGFTVAIDAVGRHDRHAVDLDYVRQSCGGLFNSGCTRRSGTATAGGDELSLLLSIGLVFGS